MKIIMPHIILCHIIKTASFWIYTFLSAITFQFLLHFRGRKHLPIFNDVLFAQEFPEKLILLWMNYDAALRLKNVES